VEDNKIEKVCTVIADLAATTFFMGALEKFTEDENGVGYVRKGASYVKNKVSNLVDRIKQTKVKVVEKEEK